MPFPEASSLYCSIDKKVDFRKNGSFLKLPSFREKDHMGGGTKNGIYYLKHSGFFKTRGLTYWKFMMPLLLKTLLGQT